jgi:hypothetical protein
MLVDPVTATASQQWASYATQTHEDALRLEQSFTVHDQATANLDAPRGNFTSRVGDPVSVSQDLPLTLHMDFTPSLDVATVASKGVQFVAAGLHKLAEWRAFFHLHMIVSSSTQPKLLTHSGHGSVTILHFDIPPSRVVSSSTARATILMITRSLCLGILRFSASTTSVWAHCKLKRIV